MNIPGLILTWFASSNQSYYAKKTYTLLHKYIDFETRCTPISTCNAGLEQNFVFHFENAISGKILGCFSLSKEPSWEDLRQYVIQFISPLCRHSSSKFFYKENEFKVCFNPIRWVKFSRFDVNIIKILPGAIMSDKEATNYLHTLIKENDSKLVKRMLCDAPSLVTKNTDLLHMVVNGNQFNEEVDESLDMIRVLIEQKCDVIQKHSLTQDGIPMLPIQIAASRHNYRTLHILIEAKAKVNFESDSYVWMNEVFLMNQCPLRLAIRNKAWFTRFCDDKKKIETVKTLINAKCCLNKFNTPILQFAIQNYNCYTEDHKVIQLLIKAKADVNASNPTGSTPLHYAALLHEPKPYCTIYLLQAKANINKKNCENQTPFWSATVNEFTKHVTTGLKSSIKALLDHKCEVNRWNKYQKDKLWRVQYLITNLNGKQITSNFLKL